MVIWLIYKLKNLSVTDWQTLAFLELLSQLKTKLHTTKLLIIGTTWRRSVHYLLSINYFYTIEIKATKLSHSFHLPHLSISIVSVWVWVDGDSPLDRHLGVDSVDVGWVGQLGVVRLLGRSVHGGDCQHCHQEGTQHCQ